MSDKKIKNMAEFVISQAYNYAVENDLTRNEGMTAMVSAYVALGFALKQDDDNVLNLKASMISATASVFDAFEKGNEE